MKSSRVHRGKIYQEAPKEDQGTYQKPPPSPNKKARAQKSIYSQNDTLEAAAAYTSLAVSGKKSGGILNRVGPTTAASDIINLVTSEHQLESPSSNQRPKTPRAIPFSVGYIPPNVRGVPPNRNVLRNKPGTANLSIQHLEDSNGVAAETYQKLFQYAANASAASDASNVQQKDNPRRPNTPEDGATSSRRQKQKPKGNKKPFTAVAAKKEPEYVEAPNNFTARIHVSKSECTMNPLKASQICQMLHANPTNDIRNFPEWLVMAAKRDGVLEKLTSSADSISTLLSSKSGTKIGPNDNPIIIKTVRMTTPQTSSRVSLMSRQKPNIPISPNKSTSSVIIGTPSRSVSQVNLKKTPSVTGKQQQPLTTQRSQTQIGTTISSRSKTKPNVRKPVQKKIDGKAFDGPGVSRAIRSAVTAIKETPAPQRMKRIPEIPVKVKSPAASDDSLKDKDSASVMRSKSKKPLKAKGKKGGKKSVNKSNTPTSEFLGSQHQMVDHQLRNLCERQKALEREVFILFESLNNVFCSDGKKSTPETKCCCSSETQDKMKSLIQKQKEVIQLQIDLRKRYGFNQIGSTFHGPNEPLLNGFNAHFGQLASYAREIDGKMVYYCATCNVACENELAFRRHAESTNHVMKTCKGIKSTQPVYTCDDCDAKMQGTTKYMSHVINSNVHNTRVQSSSSVVNYD